MTAPTRQTVEILASTPVPAGTTEATPINGPWVSVAGFNGGQLAAYVTNGATAPTAPGSFIWQGSDKNDGTNVVEIWRSAGVAAAGATSTPIPIDLPKELSYVRLVGYGNTLQQVTLRGLLFAKG